MARKWAREEAGRGGGAELDSIEGDREEARREDEAREDLLVDRRGWSARRERREARLEIEGDGRGNLKDDIDKDLGDNRFDISIDTLACDEAFIHSSWILG